MQDPTTPRQKQKIRIVKQYISTDTLRAENKVFEEKYGCDNPYDAFKDDQGRLCEPEWGTQESKDFTRWDMNLGMLERVEKKRK